MCGFTGSITLEPVDNDTLRKANQIIECRGPDSTNFVKKIIGKYTANLWFNRLSIIDLSENANQPMSSEEFKTTILFNGEIYNHKELRKELESKGVNFKSSHSDTETLLLGLSYFGVEYVNKLRGQFSIIFIDQKISKVFLIRDRLGQKPLYYHLSKNGLIFGSSLLSLLKASNQFTIDNESIYSYLNLGIVQSPKTLFNNFFKVMPAEIISFDLEQETLKSNNFIYWNPKKFVNNNQFKEEEFFELLTDSTSLRNDADVPIANFLSGGLDSTSLVKNIYGKSDINSFSVYFENPKYDESAYIEQVVRKYKLNHTFVKISSKLSSDDIFEALNSLDEPYSDPSVVPSYILSKEISKHYKVAISGDGGDELLGGYKRTIYNLRSKNSFNNLISKLYNLYPPFLGTGNKFLSLSKNIETSYMSYLEDRKLLNLLDIEIEKYNLKDIDFESNNLYKDLLLAEYKFYLPEMMMFKIDRTSMANSLEIRSPFVDHILIEYIMKSNTKYLDVEKPKNLLKNYLKDDFNDLFLNRNKQGFVFDVENWVFENYEFIKNIITSGKVLNNFNLNKMDYLLFNKSRINGQRIWKMFVLENYLSNVFSVTSRKS